MKLFPLQKCLSFTLALLLSLQGTVWSNPSHPTSEKSNILEHNNLAPQSFFTSIGQALGLSNHAPESIFNQMDTKAESSLRAIGTKQHEVNMSKIKNFQLNKDQSQNIVNALNDILNEKNLNEMKSQSRTFGVLLTAKREAAFDKSLQDTLNKVTQAAKDGKLFIAEFDSHHNPYSHIDKNGNIYLSAAYFGFKAKKGLFGTPLFSKTFDKFEKNQKEIDARTNLRKTWKDWAGPIKALQAIVSPRIAPAIAQNILYHELIANGFNNQEAYHLKGVMTYSPSNYKLGNLSENEKFIINYAVQNHHDRAWLRDVVKTTKSIKDSTSKKEEAKEETIDDFPALSAEMDVYNARMEQLAKETLAKVVAVHAKAFSKSIGLRSLYHNVAVIVVSVAVAMALHHGIVSIVEQLADVTKLLDAGEKALQIVEKGIEFFKEAYTLHAEYDHIKEGWHVASFFGVVFTSAGEKYNQYIAPYVNPVTQLLERVTKRNKDDADKLAKKAAKLAAQAEKLEKKLLEKAAAQENKAKKEADKIAQMKAESAANQEKADQLKEEIQFQENLMKQMNELDLAIKQFSYQAELKAKIGSIDMTRGDQKKLKDVLNINQNYKNALNKVNALSKPIIAQYPQFTIGLGLVMETIEKSPLNKAAKDLALSGFYIFCTDVIQMPIFEGNFLNDLSPYSGMSVAA